MSELISWMIRYMENDRFSKWQKLSRLLWVLFVAFVIDNAFGLSSIVYNSFKLDYLVKDKIRLSLVQQDSFRLACN